MADIDLRIEMDWQARMLRHFILACQGLGESPEGWVPADG